ncbi:MAG TPA: glutamyl-tRNA reductase [Acidimicrobiia bacterium]|nr:glutamyl-tRNA reductase [Acidimicrobiia bacterium]
MSLIVVGLNHRSTPVDVLERAAVTREGLSEALRTLGKREHVAEVVVLSTCNRTEVYVRATKFHPAIQEVSEFLAEQAGVMPDVLTDSLYTFHDEAAVTHLFGVASGIDSMILGEGEILGQVKASWQAAEAEGTVRQQLGSVFRQAVEVGKRARTETEIARGITSISSAAVLLASERLGSLTGKTVLVLGAGKMGEGMAAALAGSSVGDVLVANRGFDRAAALAERIGGRPVGLDGLVGALEEADVLLASTGSGEIMISRSEIEDVMGRRPARPLLVVDVAVPRDVEPSADEIPTVTVLDIDDLKAFVEASMDTRRREVERVREIIHEEVARYRLEASAREVAPLVTALRERGESIRAAELERFAARLDTLDADTREAVEALTRGIVNKLLHEPTVRVKESAGQADGEALADALAALFDLS